MEIKVTFTSIYLTLTLFGLVTDEIWNCNNPRPKPNREYLLCNWSRDDFHSFKVNGEKYNLILKQFANGDNNFKAKARKKYWDARN